MSQGWERKLKRQVAPQYLELAKRMHASGTVRLKLFVTKDGKVTDIEALGGNPVLIVAAEDAAKQWLYESGTGNSTETVEFHFHPLQ